MMPRALVIRVRFHDGCYHGAGDWPPSPARLFQALVAAAGLNGQISGVRDSLRWLEGLQPPVIGAPCAKRGQRVMFYMPNNDLDAVQGDPRRVAEIRTAKKFFHPWLFDAAVPFTYIWQGVNDAGDGHAHAILSLADRLYQLGRGIDMAWAWGELLGPAAVEYLVASHPGPIYRPSGGTGGATLRSPLAGSLASTERRHQAYRCRLEVERKGRKLEVTFRQPPQPKFHLVAYESPPSRRLYELRASSSDSSLASWPLSQASKLVVCLRDGAVERLRSALPDRSPEIDRVLVGRRPNGDNDGPTSERVRIVPLPSVGHPHADRAIRRVLVEVPPSCPLRPDDIAWAFSGLEPIDVATGEVYEGVLTPADSSRMLRHYVVGEAAEARNWRTVTPAALPGAAGRRRIDPAAKPLEVKGGLERAMEERRAAGAVIQALRHADVRPRVETIRVQREPFEVKGERVEAFAPGTRFPQRRLWHVEICFSDLVAGPLVIGDGRFLGLGVMSPVPHGGGRRDASG